MRIANICPECSGRADGHVHLRPQCIQRSATDRQCMGSSGHSGDHWARSISEDISGAEGETW